MHILLDRFEHAYQQPQSIELRAMCEPIDTRAGTNIGIAPSVLHSLPEFYPDPHRFDPDRWLDAALPNGTADSGDTCIGVVVARRVKI